MKRIVTRYAGCSACGGQNIRVRNDGLLYKHLSRRTTAAAGGMRCLGRLPDWGSRAPADPGHQPEPV